MSNLLQAIIGAGVAPADAQRLADAIVNTVSTNAPRAFGSTQSRGSFQAFGTSQDYSLYASAPSRRYNPQTREISPSPAALGVDGVAVFKGDAVFRGSQYAESVYCKGGVAASGVSAGTMYASAIGVLNAASFDSRAATVAVPISLRNSVNCDGGAQFGGDATFDGPVTIRGSVDWGGARNPSDLSVIRSLYWDEPAQKIYVHRGPVAVLNDYGTDNIDSFPLLSPGPAVSCAGTTDKIPSLCIDANGFVVALTEVDLDLARGTAVSSVGACTVIPIVSIDAKGFVTSLTAITMSTATMSVAASTKNITYLEALTVSGTATASVEIPSQSITVVPEVSKTTASSASLSITTTTEAVTFLSNVTVSVTADASVTVEGTPVDVVTAVVGDFNSTASATIGASTESVTIISSVSAGSQKYLTSVTAPSAALTYLTSATLHPGSTIEVSKINSFSATNAVLSVGLTDANTSPVNGVEDLNPVTVVASVEIDAPALTPVSRIDTFESKKVVTSVTLTGGTTTVKPVASTTRVDVVKSVSMANTSTVTASRITSFTQIQGLTDVSVLPTGDFVSFVTDVTFDPSTCKITVAKASRFLVGGISVNKHKGNLVNLQYGNVGAMNSKASLSSSVTGCVRDIVTPAVEVAKAVALAVTTDDPVTLTYNAVNVPSANQKITTTAAQAATLNTAEKHFLVGNPELYSKAGPVAALDYANWTVVYTNPTLSTETGTASVLTPSLQSQSASVSISTGTTAKTVVVAVTGEVTGFTATLTASTTTLTLASVSSYPVQFSSISATANTATDAASVIVGVTGHAVGPFVTALTASPTNLTVGQAGVQSVTLANLSITTVPTQKTADVVTAVTYYPTHVLIPCE